MTLGALEPARSASLLVAIVNYRTADLTIDCLRSLEPEVSAIGNTRVVVADNASGDGSAQAIAAAIEQFGWSRWASLLPLDHNGGFSSGNNAVIAPALAAADRPPPDFVLLLNPDTVVCPGALGALLEFMEARPDVGIAGSRVEEPDGTQQHSRYRFHSVWSELDAGLRLGLVSRFLRKYTVAPPLCDQAHSTDWVVGAAMIVRREVFEDIGLLDPGYFLYFEEADFCLTARRAGWTCWYVPTSRIVHLVGRSSGITDPSLPAVRRPRYWFESRRRYFVKNHGRAYALCADAAWLLGFALWRVRRMLQGKPDSDPPHMLWDFLRFRVRPGPTAATPRERRRTLAKVGRGLLLCLLCVALLETSARLLTSHGSNGMPHFGRFPLLPFRPSESLFAEPLGTDTGPGYIVGDAELGWTVAAHRAGAGADGRTLYQSNSQGLRAPPEHEYGPEPAPGKVRIVTVGDSFTHGDEVRDPETWQRVLEELRDDVEVLNLGVPGYGTDQALLRWRRDGRRFRAQIVVLGIWPENMCRNLGLIRYYLVPTEGFSSKPMMSVEDGVLVVINSPTLPRDELIAALTRPEAQPLLRRDFWYSERETQTRLHQRSRLLRIADSLLALHARAETRAQIYSGAEPSGIEITAAIAQQFAREVRAVGSTPLVLLFPMQELLDRQTGPEPLALVAALREQGLAVIDLGPAIGRAALARGDARLFTEQGHLSAEGNRLLALNLGRELDPWLAAAQR